VYTATYRGFESLSLRQMWVNERFKQSQLIRLGSLAFFMSLHLLPITPY
jgi:hypothetical protein